MNKKEKAAYYRGVKDSYAEAYCIYLEYRDHRGQLWYLSPQDVRNKIMERIYLLTEPEKLKSLNHRKL